MITGASSSMPPHMAPEMFLQEFDMDIKRRPSRFPPACISHGCVGSGSSMHGVGLSEETELLHWSLKKTVLSTASRTRPVWPRLHASALSPGCG